MTPVTNVRAGQSVPYSNYIDWIKLTARNAMMYGRRFTEGVPNKPVAEFEVRWTLSDW
jgi:desulfoferrodoxin (superoxide reductase-like protein)